MRPRARHPRPAWLQVNFPLDLDLYDLVTPELRAELEGPRTAYKDWEDAQIEARKRIKVWTLWGGGGGGGAFHCS